MCLVGDESIAGQDGDEQASNGQRELDGDEAGEQGPRPNLRAAPTRPDQEDVDRHYAAGHVPRRLWCPVCAHAALDEDPDRRSVDDHHDDGLAMVCLDYKEFAKMRPQYVVMRERFTGQTCGVECAGKGADDTWLVQRLGERIPQWGLKDFVLWLKSDGEHGMRALQKAIREARGSGTVLMNSPLHDPQGTGVAERAVN